MPTVLHLVFMKKRTDFLVIGSGIAGLTFALEAVKYGKVTIVTKANLDDTNTRYAQGGIAAVFSEPDNFEKHINDTLIAGGGICNEEVVRIMTSTIIYASAFSLIFREKLTKFLTRKEGK